MNEENDTHKLIGLDGLMSYIEEDTPRYFRDVTLATPAERRNVLKMNDMDYIAAKTNLELYARELPRDITKADLILVKLMSILPDLKTKIYWDYEKAAANDDANAMLMVAICHSIGFAVEMDTYNSLNWLTKAANAGSLDAMLNIAENYQIIALPVEPKVAFPWYLKAAEEGNNNAAYHTYSCYDNGYGVEANKQKAYYWHRIWVKSWKRGPTSEVSNDIYFDETPLHHAARLGNVGAMIFLLKLKYYETDINAVNNNEETAFHIAARYGHVEVAKLLMITFGADGNVKTKSKRTPLELAAGKGHIEIVRLLVDETTITTLDLSDSKLGSSDACSLAETLNMYTALTKLELRVNNFAVEGSWALVNWLKQNSTLVWLSLCSNNIGPEGAYALAECLKQNSTLAWLSLSWNGIGDTGSSALAECLKQNTTLTELYLESNNIGFEGAWALAKCLKQNSTLTLLDLGLNENINDESIYALAEALEHNSTLTQLNLHTNDIGFEGANALAECLKKNSTLSQLNLNSNNIGTEGALVLAECLKHNTTLSHLYLRMNNIGIVGVYGLADCLTQNFTLSQLHLGGNEIGDDGALALLESLLQNSTLTQLDIGYNSDEFGYEMKSFLSGHPRFT